MPRFAALTLCVFRVARTRTTALATSVALRVGLQLCRELGAASDAHPAAAPRSFSNSSSELWRLIVRGAGGAGRAEELAVVLDSLLRAMCDGASSDVAHTAFAWLRGELAGGVASAVVEAAAAAATDALQSPLALRLERAQRAASPQLHELVRVDALHPLRAAGLYALLCHAGANERVWLSWRWLRALLRWRWRARTEAAVLALPASGSAAPAIVLAFAAHAGALALRRLPHPALAALPPLLAPVDALVAAAFEAGGEEGDADAALLQALVAVLRERRRLWAALCRAFDVEGFHLRARALGRVAEALAACPRLAMRRGAVQALSDLRAAGERLEQLLGGQGPRVRDVLWRAEGRPLLLPPTRELQRLRQELLGLSHRTMLPASEVASAATAHANAGDWAAMESPAMLAAAATRAAGVVAVRVAATDAVTYVTAEWRRLWVEGWCTFERALREFQADATATAAARPGDAAPAASLLRVLQGLPAALEARLRLLQADHRKRLDQVRFRVRVLSEDEVTFFLPFYFVLFLLLVSSLDANACAPPGPVASIGDPRRATATHRSREATARAVRQRAVVTDHDER